MRFATTLLLMGCVSAGAPGYFRFPTAVATCPVPGTNGPVPGTNAAVPGTIDGAGTAVSGTEPVVMDPLPFPENSSGAETCAIDAVASCSVPGTQPAAVRASIAAQAQCAVPGTTALPVCTEFFGLPLQGQSDVVFLLDRSESMAETAYFGDQSQQQGSPARVDGVAIGIPAWQSGPLLPDKLTVAKRELLKVLDHLPDGTRFAIAFFGDDVAWFSPQLTTLDATTRAEAHRFTDSIHPHGATATLPAVTAALALSPRRVVLLSDGISNFEGDAPQLNALLEQRRAETRIDTISIEAAALLTRNE